MAKEEARAPLHERFAHVRFAVVGPLLAAPPPRGGLRAAIAALAEKTWRHPGTGEPVRFSAKSIERWYLRARQASRDPVGGLRKKVRRDRGRVVAMRPALRTELLAQHAEHPGWSMKLHADNLGARVRAKSELGPMPSYRSVVRFMKQHGLVRGRRLFGPHSPGRERAQRRLESREVRSYEAGHVNGLWHFDFHHGSRKVLGADGAWATPILLAFLDDRSRLCCHGQWYLDETTATLVHGFSQAVQKRGLPRAALSDNGPAMTADEFVAGLERLSIVAETTLPYSPYQNGKQEVFWAQVEGRLLSMLEGVEDVSLSLLNEATQAWIEGEYHRRVHEEIATTPLLRYLAGPDVGRPSPSSEELRAAFTALAVRTQRRSDGTVSLEGRRFEVPGRFRHLERVHVRYARWDLTSVHLVDPATSARLGRLYPQDKEKNAQGVRRVIEPVREVAAPVASTGMAPLLRELLARYAATGLPPAYLPPAPLPPPAPPAAPEVP